MLQFLGKYTKNYDLWARKVREICSCSPIDGCRDGELCN